MALLPSSTVVGGSLPHVGQFLSSERPTDFDQFESGSYGTWIRIRLLIEFDQTILQCSIPFVLNLLRGSLFVLSENPVKLSELIACVEIEWLHHQNLLQQLHRLFSLSRLLQESGLVPVRE